MRNLLVLDMWMIDKIGCMVVYTGLYYVRAQLTMLKPWLTCKPIFIYADLSFFLIFFILLSDGAGGTRIQFITLRPI